MEWLDWLGEVVATPRLRPEVREEAAKLRRELLTGTIPAPYKIARVRELVDAATPGPCKNTKPNGTCDLIRGEGTSWGIPIPPVGQATPCAFPLGQDKCPGYESL
jgi:hypothetical protein